jgi:hypothetical protein
MDFWKCIVFFRFVLDIVYLHLIYISTLQLLCASGDRRFIQENAQVSAPFHSYWLIPFVMIRVKDAAISWRHGILPIVN